MKAIHWFSLAAFFLGLALLFTGHVVAGGVCYGLATLVELLYSICTGKSTNEGMD